MKYSAEEKNVLRMYSSIWYEPINIYLNVISIENISKKITMDIKDLKLDMKKNSNAIEHISKKITMDIKDLKLDMKKNLNAIEHISEKITMDIKKEILPSDEELLDFIKYLIEILDNCFTKNKNLTKNNMILYRGSKKFTEGIQKNFISTSEDMNVAAGFGKLGKNGKIYVNELHIENGTSYIPMNKYSEAIEDEILLPRNLNFIFIKRIEKKKLIIDTYHLKNEKIIYKFSEKEMQELISSIKKQTIQEIIKELEIKVLLCPK